MSRDRHDDGPLHGLDELLRHTAHAGEMLAQARDAITSTNGMMRRGAEPREVIAGKSKIIATSPGQLAGWSFRETAGAAAVIRLRDGQDPNGGLVATIALAAAASSNTWHLPNGASFTAGLFCEVVSGTIEGVVYVGPFGRP